MEIIGGFSAILTVAVEFDHINRRLRRCYRALKYARQDIKTIRDEVESFSSLLGQFHSTITDDRLTDESFSTRITRSKILEHIVRSGETALDKIAKILVEVDPLRTDKVHPTHMQWIARWKWYRRKEEWIPIQLQLNSIKASASLLISTVFCQQLIQKFEQLRAEQRTIPNELLQQLSLCTSQVNSLISRCKRTAKKMRRASSQNVYILQIGQEIPALASHLARSHILSHPELEAVLKRNGVPSFVSNNSTASRISRSSGSAMARPSDSSSPRGPQSGPSSGHVAVPEPPSDTADHASVPEINANSPARPPPAEILLPVELAPGSRIPSGQVSASGRSSMDSGPGTSGPSTSRPPSARSIPADNGKSWIPTALFGPPEPSTRPPNPRHSDANLSERPVIVDDDWGLREEFRRPRRGPASSRSK